MLTLHFFFLLIQTNKYMQEAEPWNASPESQRVLYIVAESLRLTGILLQPFMPSKSQQLLDILRVNNTRRGFSDAKFGSDAEYGEDVKKSILFPPLIVEE